MNAELEMFCHRLLAALINGAYQGLLLVLLVWLGLRMVPRVNAATRHVVLFVTLLFAAMMPVFHFFLPGAPEIFASAQGSSTVTASTPERGKIIGFRPRGGSTSDEPAAAKVPSEAVTVVSQETMTFHRSSKVARPTNVGRSVTVSMGRQSENELSQGTIEGASLGNSSLSEMAQEPNPAWPMELLRSSPSIPRGWRLALPDRMSVVLIGAWLAVAFSRLGVLAWQCCRLRSMKRHGTPAPEASRALFEKLRHEMDIKRKTRLMTCDDCPAPMVAGFRQPAVLFPAKMLEDTPAIHAEPLLRHELAHVSRWDDWTNLVQQTITATLFFQPGIRWLSGRLAVEREIACDDHVLAATRAARSYALLLTEFAGRMQGRDAAAAPAAWSNKNQLTERINMILNSDRNSSPRPARTRAGVLAAAAALVAILCFGVGPRLTFAAQEPSTVNATVEVGGVKAQPAQPSLEPASVPAPAIVAATETPPAPSADTSESDPRPKPTPAPEIAPVPPHAAPAPRPMRVYPGSLAPVPPAMPVPGHAAVLASPSGDVLIQPRAIVRSAAGSRPPVDRSLERRLERLEQLVESLIAKDKEPTKRAGADLDFKFDLQGPDIAFEKEKFDKLAADSAKLAEKFSKDAVRFSKDALNDETLARIKDQARREAERVREQVIRDTERAVRNTDRAAREMQRAMEMELKHAPAGDPRSFGRDALKQRRQTLEAQRKSLERQMQALGRQIEQLEEQDERLQETIERQIEQREQQQKRQLEQLGGDEKRTKGLDRADEPVKQQSPKTKPETR